MRGSAFEVAARFQAPPKGEITLVIGAAADAALDPRSGDAVAAVSELVAAGIARGRAAELVARLTGVARNELYRGSL